MDRLDLSEMAYHLTSRLSIDERERLASVLDARGTCLGAILQGLADRWPHETEGMRAVYRNDPARFVAAKARTRIRNLLLARVPTATKV